MELHGNSPEFVTFYEELSVATNRGVSLVDITQDIRNILSKSGCLEGLVTVLSRHSTVSVTINEMEGRLVDDTRQFLLNLAPPSYPYLHNDLDYRYGLFICLTLWLLIRLFLIGKDHLTGREGMRHGEHFV